MTDDDTPLRDDVLRVLTDAPEPIGIRAIKAKPDRKPKAPAKPHQPLEAACAALEQALVALVQDPATLAVVRAYMALKAQS
jgi:hypothetical protein